MVGIVIRLRPGQPTNGDCSGQKQEISSIFSKSIQAGYEAHQTTYQIGPGATFLGVKWPGRKTQRSTPSSSKVNNERNYTCT